VIPYGRQIVGNDDIEAVTAVLRSDFLTQGPAVPRFEEAISAYCGARHAVAVNSATSALHIACLALGAGPGDRVWVSPNTFVATANAALYCGASVDFVDIDPATRNMSTHALEQKLEYPARTSALPKIVIPTHFAGLPCDMASIRALRERYGFSIIEDAAHAIGARVNETKIGDCAHSDITVFSFHPVKIITTGEGGMATTNDASLARKMQLLRSHGVTREPGELECAGEGGWYYEQQLLGFNYRMTDIQAALGLSQLSKIEAWIARRHGLASVYDKELSGLPLILPERRAGVRTALHLYVVEIDGARTRLERKTVFDMLRGSGVGVNVHYIPVHTQPFYRGLGFTRGAFPHSERYYSRCLSLPMHAALTDEQQGQVIDSLNKACETF
jgi:UDP-4-amino-4,6-dideoxy-N-acetyl-beta-L-altrosamine transaminase